MISIIRFSGFRSGRLTTLVPLLDAEAPNKLFLSPVPLIQSFCAIGDVPWLLVLVPSGADVEGGNAAVGFLTFLCTRVVL